MAEKEKQRAYKCQGYAIAFLIVIVICIIISTATIYIKINHIQNDLDDTSSRFTNLEEANNKNLDLIISEIITNRASTDSVKKSMDETKVEMKEILSLIVDIMKGMSSDIEGMQKAASNVWKIERFPANNEIVLKQQNSVFKEGYNGIGVNFRKSENGFVILDIIPDTPAERADLYSGDEITKVNGESTQGMTNEEFFNKVRGPVGTTVSIEYRPSGSLVTLKNAILTRGNITLEKPD